MNRSAIFGIVLQQTNVNKETANHFTDMIQSFVGGDAKQTAYQFFKKEFDKTFARSPGILQELYWSGIDGYSFIIRGTRFGDEKEPQDVFIGGEHDEVQSSQYTEVESEDGVDMALTAFEFINNCMKCSSCPRTLALCSNFGICGMCRRFYQDTPCRVCHGHFGYFSGGKHSWC